MARVELVESIAVGAPLVPVVGATVQLKNADDSPATHFDARTGGVASTADLVTDVFGRIRGSDQSRRYLNEGQDYKVAWSGGTPPVAPGERWLRAPVVV